MQAQRLRRYYLGGMASVMGVDVVITGIYILIAERADLALTAALANIVVLGGLNVAGSAVLFRPIHDMLATGIVTDDGRHRLRMLPRLSAGWMAAVTVLYCAFAFGAGGFVPAVSSAASPGTGLLAAAAVWFTLVYVILYAAFAFFFVSDLTTHIRHQLTVRFGVEIPPGQGRYIRRLLGIFVLIAGFPAALIAGDLLIFREFRALQGLSPTETVLLDVFAGTFALTAALVFATRNLINPLAELERVIDQLGHGSLSVAAAVTTDDEIGRLTQRFNRMIEDRRVAQRRVEDLANKDPLTGQLSRNGFLHRLGEQAPEGDRWLAVIDLVDFQAINDGLGLDTGNAVIIAMAERLEAHLPAVPVARLYGDIFAIAPAPGTTPAAIEAQVLPVFETPFHVAGNRIRLFPALGAAHTEVGVGVETALQRALMAMKRGKAQGASGICVYDEGMQVAVQTRQRIAAGLQNAIRNDELSVAYQPIVSLADAGRPVGFEALMRWHTPDGPISPATFIPVAESSGLILDLGDWLIRRVAADLATLKALMPEVYVAINLSARQIEDGTAMETMLTALANAGLPVSATAIEVTESLAMDEASFPIADRLATLHRTGLNLSLDDFGTGHSSLVRLKELPVSQVKIDRGFVDGMESDPRRESIVRNVLSLARDLDLDVVAEGIETEHHVTMLQRFGCPKAQGYYFSRPLSFASACAFLQENVIKD